MEILKACDVTKIFRGTQVPVKALEHVTIGIEKGEFVAIIGRSGSGKSTLLNVLSGIEHLSSGNILFRNEDLTCMEDEELSFIRRKHIGFVFQAFHLLPEFTVFENILLPTYIDNEEPDLNYIEQLLKQLNITSLKDHYPNQLSGGEQQRVAIARALSAKPDILFADEPTGNLDRKTGEEVMNLFSVLQRRLGQTIVMATHDLEIAKLADKIIHLEDGKVVTRLEAET